MIVGGVDWTNVLDSLIAAIPAIIAAIISAVYSLKIHGQIKTPSGKSIGEVAEYSHDTAIANNLLLSKHNGPTKDMQHEDVTNETPQMPEI